MADDLVIDTPISRATVWFWLAARSADARPGVPQEQGQPAMMASRAAMFTTLSTGIATPASWKATEGRRATEEV